jgi:hypothetical protein
MIPYISYKVNQIVRDGLTGKISVVSGIEYKHGKRFGERCFGVHTVAIWLNNDYLGGGRNPWEISKPYFMIGDKNEDI